MIPAPRAILGYQSMDCDFAGKLRARGVPGVCGLAGGACLRLVARADYDSPGIWVVQLAPTTPESISTGMLESKRTRIP